MKKRLAIQAFLIITLSANGQIEADNIKYQWQRTAYERWDNFKPGSLFDDFEIFGIKIWGAPLGDYKDSDRRTIYAHAGNMALWSMYADHYDMYQRGTDSIYRQETYKALDRTMNKNWLLFQKGRTVKLYDKIEGNIQTAKEEGLPPNLTEILESAMLNITKNIDFIREQYVPDADKYPLIEREINALEELLVLTQNIGDLSILLEFDEGNDTMSFDFEQPVENTRALINSLIDN